MKKSDNAVSPFIILLIPALLVIGYKGSSAYDVQPEKQDVSLRLQTPCFKGVIKAIF